MIAGLGRCRGRPERDDIIVGLAPRRQLEQGDRTRSPWPLRFDPQARALLIKDAVVLIMIEIAIALKEAETLGIVVRKAVGDGMRRIVERPPYPFARAGQKGQPVAVVDFGAPVGRLVAIALAIPEHRGERGKAKPFDILAQRERQAHVLRHALRSAPIDETPCARGARTIEQGIYGKRVAWAAFQPEMAEIWELLGPAEPRVDCQPTRGQTILVERARRSEIGRALESEPVALAAGAHQSEAGKTGDIGRQTLGPAEQVAPEIERTHPPVLDQRHRDRRVCVAIEREEADRSSAVRPHGRLRPEGDTVERVVGYRLGARRRRRWRHISARGDGGSLCLQHLPRKGLAGGRARGGESGAGQRGGGACDQLAAGRGEEGHCGRIRNAKPMGLA